MDNYAPTDTFVNEDHNEEVENGDSSRHFVWEDITNYRGQKGLSTGGFGCRVEHMIQVTFWNLSELFFKK